MLNKKQGNPIPTVVQKSAVITILTFLSSSVLLGAVSFFLKDTVDKVNDTIERVNKTQISIQHFEDTMSTFGDKLDILNISIVRTTQVLDNYTRVHGQNLANVSVSMTRVTEKLIDLTGRCDEADEDLEKFNKHILIYEHDKAKEVK